MNDWSFQRSNTEQVLGWDKFPQEIKQERDKMDTKFPINTNATASASSMHSPFTVHAAGYGQGMSTSVYGEVQSFGQPMTGSAQSTHHAYTFLQKAVDAMKDRAAVRDVQNATNPAKQGERSMKATVAAFNGLTGRDLTEEEGWEFMILLKLVRGRQGSFRDDDYIDGAAYFGLLGECASNNR